MKLRVAEREAIARWHRFPPLTCLARLLGYQLTVDVNAFTYLLLKGHNGVVTEKFAEKCQTQTETTNDKRQRVYSLPWWPTETGCSIKESIKRP